MSSLDMASGAVDSARRIAVFPKKILWLCGIANDGPQLSGVICSALSTCSAETGVSFSVQGSNQPAGTPDTS